MSFRALSFLSAPALLTCALLIGASAGAHEYKAGEIRVAHPHARPGVPGQTSGAAYIGLENPGKTGDKLLSASSPAAKSVELHMMSMDGNIMRMREVNGIDIPPGANIVMKPGDGYHLMMVGLSKPLKAGDKIPLRLVFEKFGPLEVSVLVTDENSSKNTDATPSTAEPAHQH